MLLSWIFELLQQLSAVSLKLFTLTHVDLFFFRIVDIAYSRCQLKKQILSECYLFILITAHFTLY